MGGEGKGKGKGKKKVVWGDEKIGGELCVERTSPLKRNGGIAPCLVVSEGKRNGGGGRRGKEGVQWRGGGIC